jgi:hypothetical protein
VYAEGAETRVPSSSDSAAVASLASAAPGGRVQVLLGRLDRVPTGARPLSLQLKLRGLERALGGASEAIVSVRLLPDSAEAPLPDPPLVKRRRVPVSGADLRLDVGALRPHQALIVTVAAD